METLREELKLIATRLAKQVSQPIAKSEAIRVSSEEIQRIEKENTRYVENQMQARKIEQDKSLSEISRVVKVEA